ncbi:MAG: class IV adenylate cyclase [Desulfovibrio sp.]|nr:class IV adenylate cyclase [Desulfovibrio sp.]
MALEIECKYCGVDEHRVRSQLDQIATKESFHFERNCVFESTPPVLFSKHWLLRLRTTYARANTRVVLTLKRPPAAEQRVEGLKVYDERELVVDDAEKAAFLLRGLGYVPCAIYEKVREMWRLGGCSICLDWLPFGFFVEIEGQAADIDQAKEALGLSMCVSSDQSYHALHTLYCETHGLPTKPGFIFSDADRLMWCGRVGIPDMGSIPTLDGAF